ncbi:homoserine kinase [Georgenia yuyongxinii]|uniref:Homoserine kinase n=1 Tax=Georgenia yuyongxinii TaxID=2589797 RepID=A0A552WJG6_9MICO|nr:homoserine kinase [Georgenia yuyongxinii]TRW42898.1 homoserine kinase [Georgenia yuyongxinii]
MRLVRDQVRVRVPATSANLGPGFDTLGLALGVWDEISVRAVAGETTVTVTGEGAGELPDGEGHLVVRAVRAGLEHAGAPQAGLDLICHNVIPHGRGMGSSAAAVVAGLIAARGLVSEPEALDDDAVLTLATQLEGHPDNAAPALLGGATAAWVDALGPHAAAVPLHDDFAPTVLVPEHQLLTHTARAVLPREVPHSDAAFNVARTALLILALGGQTDLLMAATEDQLHQHYRADAMRETAEVVRALREAGWPAVISGAGPSVLVLDDLDAPTTGALTGHGWRVVRPGVPRAGAHLY